MKRRDFLKISTTGTLGLISFSTCKFKLPTQANYPDSDLDIGSEIRAIWSPYVGVHLFGIYENLQQPHLEKLIKAGMLQGVRLENLNNPAAQYFARWFQGQGVEVLGLFDNKYLREPNICEIFGQHILANPQIITWEIGNEVGGFIGMSPEEYMGIASKLFYYVKQNHPHIKLAIGAVAGSGSSADDLRRMIDAGLDKLCQDGLEIVPIHFYSWRTTRLQEFKSQIERLPPQVRIWITETNNMPPSWDSQIGYVKEIYPKLKSSLKAERIYWYVFSQACKKEYSLVEICNNGGRVEYSPLMKLLINNDSVVSPALKEDFLTFQDGVLTNKKLGRKREKSREKRIRK